jgi:prophage maintenance system killer protein
MFLDLNDVHWDPDRPQVDEAESAILAVAAAQVDEAWVADWLRSRAHFPTTDAPPG